MVRHYSHADGWTGAETATFLPPIGPISNPARFVAPAILQSNYPPDVKQMMAKVAVELYQDPMIMEWFCDRVYQLLREDISRQQERAYSYGRRS